MTHSSTPSIRSVSSDPLFQVRLLAALRGGDPAELHPFLTEIGKTHGSKANDDNELAASTLHLAIRCASYDTVTLLLAHRSISPNAIYPPTSQVTALHLAASLGRADIVSLLLEQEDIDDTTRDEQGRTVIDVASKECKEILQESRDTLARNYLSLFSNYLSSPPNAPPPPALITLLSSPRVKLLDLSTLDPTTGTSILHEAAKRKDLRMVELLVRAGADVFVRDRRGRAVGEGEKGYTKADDQVKVFLRQFTNRATTLIDTSASEPPSLKGYLNKYTNVARGYNTRWFVLKDGMLSYYRNQDDENLACRGSISMRNAKLKVSVSDRLRFEVASTPSRIGSSSAQKWYMRANHPVEVARWTQAISGTIDWYNKSPLASTPSVAFTPLRNGPALKGASGYASDSASMRGSASMDTSSIYASSWKSPRKSRPASSNGRRGRGNSPNGSMESAAGDESSAEQPRPSDILLDKADTESMDSSRASGRSGEQIPPFQDKFTLQGNSTQAQIDLTSQLAVSVSQSSSASSSSKAAELNSALLSSLETVSSMFKEHVSMAKEREAWYERRYNKEKEKSAMWEDSLGLVVGESETLERNLLRLRKEKRGMQKALRASMLVSPEVMSGTDDHAGGTVKQSKAPELAPLSLESAPRKDVAESSPQAIVPPAVIVSSPPPDDTAATRPISPPVNASHTRAPLWTRQSDATVTQTTSAQDDEASDSEDSSDEFFDFIDNDNVPNLVVSAPLVSPPPPMNPVTESLLDIHQYDAYAHPRERLPISSDNRPPVSLWAVLKGSIGKDLTKISFPVFFNEPTSMLQRMAEDMEFTECLDAAVVEKDAHKRLAFVAAFAMSNYSSTIGRIAKPFNPMLGETFEYCRIDRQYRYISEQVSHHPPISACIAESPTWSYYGEVDAKNKFMGKSFEIRPTGVAHADLKLPTEFVADPALNAKYPRSQNPVNAGKLVEHYSWKKVTTNVSGFIVGNPTIDHYGDMTVTNHRTGDTCVLTFKPRGWRANTACEIKGSVMDASGRVTWEIAGRWNSQLVARRAGSGNGDLLPDVSLSGSGASSGHGQPEYILLWRNTEKPPFPFNLTPFAITLNDCPSNLRPFLPPTDCRLRPDQRSFENGLYDRANDLKGANEELQRATRRKRELGQLPQHKPRWFEATTDGDTGERVWAPLKSGERVEYWTEREKVWKSGAKELWTNVEKIFVDEE